MDYSFSRANLSRCVRPEDRYQDPSLQLKASAHVLYQQAADMASTGFEPLPSIQKLQRNGKPVYRLMELAPKLLLRQCAKNIRSACRVRFKPRARILQELCSFLQDGSPYRIYRLDIRSFFESCSVSDLLVMLKQKGVTQHTLMLLQAFFDHMSAVGCAGLPRGVEISPVAGEVYLQAFDAALRDHAEVFYYARFVDDIVIVTSGRETKKQFIGEIRKALPPGLHLNHNKTQVCDVPGNENGGGATVNYLGYQVCVTSPSKKTHLGSYRDVDIRLSPKKIKREKTKIHRSFREFYLGGSYEDLRDRIAFLTSNRDLIRGSEKRRIPTGVYYSNSLLKDKSCLLELDGLLKKLIIHGGGRCATGSLQALSPKQKRELMGMSFGAGFEKRVFKRFSAVRTSRLAKVWQAK